MKSCRFLLAVACCSLFISSSYSQETDPSVLTLDRIFKKHDFSSPRFGPARWVDDGSGYTTLEKSGSGSGQDIVLNNPKNGKQTILVSATKLIAPGASDPFFIENYAFSRDKSQVIIFTNAKRVWRRKTRGDYWVLNRGDGKLQQLGTKFDESTLMFATFSPDGQKVAYVVKNNLFVEDIATGKIVQLTQDGSDVIINGTFDWVYEEEFGLRNGFRWSPDSKRIAYWRLDSSGIETYYLINNTDSLYPKLTPIKYPKVGTVNSECKVGIVSASGGATLWLDIPGDARDNYVARMDWADNSEEVILQRLNRLQNTNRVMIGNAKTGEMRTAFTDKDEAWVDVRDNLYWFDKGKKFTWLSEQDGWRHIYAVSRDGSGAKLLTPGDYDAIAIQGINQKKGLVYFIASPDNATQRYLYQTKLSGKGQARRLTPADQPGTHRYQVSQDGKWAIHTYDTFDTPPVISLVALPSHKVVKTLVDNQGLQDKMAALNVNHVEFFKVNIGNGVELDAWQIKPPNFDPNKKYPLFFYVYGEPAGQTVLDRWGRDRSMWHRFISQQGYVVMSVDNRGTPAPKGRAWRKSIYRQIGILASKDQAAAAKAIMQKFSYIDASRVGIWGWSGGGSMTLNMMFRYPEIYHTGMSVAPVPNQRLYDTIYQERYMGLPKDNEEGFRDGSSINFAKQLQGNLLLVHGTGDDNVHYQGSEQLINELIKDNKLFSFMSYPNRTHAIRERENTTRHLFETLTKFLLEHLSPGAKEDLSYLGN